MSSLKKNKTENKNLLCHDNNHVNDEQQFFGKLEGKSWRRNEDDEERSILGHC